MKENLDLLKPVMPVPGTKGYLVLEHLTSADLRDRGQEREAESVIRLSLCESRRVDCWVDSGRPCWAMYRRT